MRNDYLGFGILKDIDKYQKRLLSVLLKPNMSIEEKTLTRMKVYKMSYKELVKKLKEFKT